MSKLNKFKDIILAGAVGDAFGYFVEFDPLEWIHHKWDGDITFTDMLVLKPQWKISDDTQMTLFCLDAIQPDFSVLLRPLDAMLSEILSSYYAWYQTQYQYKMLSNTPTPSDTNHNLSMFSSLYTREAPGNTCLDSLSRSGIRGTIDNQINNSKGCGGIMRVAPISFLMLPYNQIFNLGAAQAALTHGHPFGYLSAGVFALILKLSIDDINWNTPETLLIIKSMYNGFVGEDEFNAYFEKVLKTIDDPEILRGCALNAVLGEGWVGEEAMGIALYCASKFKTFTDVIEAASNHDGDSDSTASLAAQLFVAMGGELDPRCHQVPLTCKDVIEYEFDKMDKNITY